MLHDVVITNCIQNEKSNRKKPQNEQIKHGPLKKYM